MGDPILLYVEDEDLAASLFEMVLGELDLRVTLVRVKDGEEALAFLYRAGNDKPDLVLLDLCLPGRSCFEVLAAIKNDAGLRSLPVVMFSSSSRPADKRKALELGACGFITKPPSVQGMREAVRQACSYLPRH
jgi:CheY-like chemotaxis protein